MLSKFFDAWSSTVSEGPIPTQSFVVDMRQKRQFVDWYTKPETLAFARANPGQLYIIGDEPDQFCQTPEEYAEIYRAGILAIRSVDPTAKFSPAGFAEPNYYCTQSSTYDKSWDDAHSINYAERFYNEYVRKYGAMVVNEWRFHDFATTVPTGDVEMWWNRVDKMATWSMNHGAKMYLGSWGFLGWSQSTEVFQSQIRNLMNRLEADTRIVGAAWWSLGPWIDSTHPLMLDGVLTPIGQTYTGSPITPLPIIIENTQGDKMTDAELVRMTALEKQVAELKEIINVSRFTNTRLSPEQWAAAKNAATLLPNGDRNVADRMWEVGVSQDNIVENIVPKLVARVAALESKIR